MKAWLTGQGFETTFLDFDKTTGIPPGEILLKRDPANPATAEDAYQTAIAVAKRQGTRSFELRAALELARLYQSTGRPIEAHAVFCAGARRFRAHAEKSLAEPRFLNRCIALPPRRLMRILDSIVHPSPALVAAPDPRDVDRGAV